MKCIFWTLLVTTVMLLINSCGQSDANVKHNEPDASEIHDWNIALDEAIIHDGFNPPVAARIYSYSNLIYYYLLCDSSEQVDNVRLITEKLPKIANSKDFSTRSLRAGIGFYLVAKQLMYTDALLDKHYADWKASLLKNGWTENDIAKEDTIVKEFTTKFIEWMNADGYPLTRSMPRYTLLEEEGQWRPTPQDYMEALEPHWSTIRPFLLNSSAQFRPDGPIEYDLNPKSDFMVQFDSLLKTTRNLTKEQTLIALHWDDNSLVAIHNGHSTTVEKKLTPGGHWMNICRGLAIREKLTLKESARLYCQLTMGMQDGFIACWEAKYYFHSIRPVTVIVDHLDQNWKPLLVTPSFPEYPSGHSTVSSIAGTILADYFGAKTPFIDRSEVQFGYAPRNFSSFEEAVQEVSDSRYYGGIHFTKALDDGVELGKEIANFHLNEWKKH